MRRHNMDIPPLLQLPMHVERRRKRRSTASHGDERWEDAERVLLEAGIRPQWLQIHRIIGKRWGEGEVLLPVPALCLQPLRV